MLEFQDSKFALSWIIEFDCLFCYSCLLSTIINYYFPRQCIYSAVAAPEVLKYHNKNFQLDLSVVDQCIGRGWVRQLSRIKCCVRVHSACTCEALTRLDSRGWTKIVLTWAVFDKWLSLTKQEKNCWILTFRLPEIKMPLVLDMQKISPASWSLFQDSCGRLLDEYSVRKWTFFEVSSLILDLLLKGYPGYANYKYTRSSRNICRFYDLV